MCPENLVVSEAQAIKISSNSDCKPLGIDGGIDPIFHSVSVVIPCWNSSAYIEKTIKSVLNQKCVIAKIIVVDDGSTDNSCDVVRQFGSSVDLIASAHIGSAAARNLGLSLVSSRYVMFLDSDDWLREDAISEWILSGEKTQADIVFGPWSWVWPNGRERPGYPEMIKIQSKNQLLGEWLCGKYIPPVAVLWRTVFIQNIGGWNNASKRNDDGDLVCRALSEDLVRISITDRGQGFYRQHSSPQRISTRRTFEAINSTIQALESLEEKIESLKDPNLRLALAVAYYLRAREAFRLGWIDLGYLALAKSRRLGMKGHSGTLCHRAISSIFGLRGKELLAAIMTF